MPAICAIGKTGGAALPKDGFSDIDLFVFCKQIPSQRERRTCACLVPDHNCCISERMNIRMGARGFAARSAAGSLSHVFHREHVLPKSISSILRGERTQREENYFYPTGRCASILGMHAFYDPDGFLAGLRRNVRFIRRTVRCDCSQRICRRSTTKRIFSGRSGARMCCSSTRRSTSRWIISCRRSSHSTASTSPAVSVRWSSSMTFAIKPEHCEATLQRVIERGSRRERSRNHMRYGRDFAKIWRKWSNSIHRNLYNRIQKKTPPESSE